MKNSPIKSNDCGETCQPIKPFGYPDLPCPETPLGRRDGLPGRGMAHRLSALTAKQCDSFPHVAGWLAMVLGGCVLLLWGIPLVAAALGAMPHGFWLILW